MLAVALAAMLASPAVARKLDPAAMLVASSPAKDSTVEAGIDTIVLTFAKPAGTARDYTVSYLLTSKSFKSLNGFIEFEIAGGAGLALPSTSSAPATQERN